MFVTALPVKSAPAASTLAAAFARIATESIVISPLKIEIEDTSVETRAFAIVSVTTDALAVTDPVLMIEPSAGYRNASPKATASGGADTAPVTAPAWPAAVTRTA